MKKLLRLAAAALATSLLAGCGSTASFGPPSPTVPSTYRSYFSVAARRCPGVLTPGGLAGQGYVESRFRPDALSTANAQGLMQLSSANWTRYGADANGDGRADPFNPADSIATAAKFDCALARAVRTIPGNSTDLRLAAYNAGLNAVRKYRAVPPFPETQQYVEQVRSWTHQFDDEFSSS